MIARRDTPYCAAMRLTDRPASTTICWASRFAAGACCEVSGPGAATSAAPPFAAVGVGVWQAATNPRAAMAAAARNMRFCTRVHPPIPLRTLPRRTGCWAGVRPSRRNIYAGITTASQHVDAFPFASAGVRRHGERIAGRPRGNRSQQVRRCRREAAGRWPQFVSAPAISLTEHNKNLY
jgi:hypothetical protein